MAGGGVRNGRRGRCVGETRASEAGGTAEEECERREEPYPPGAQRSDLR